MSKSNKTHAVVWGTTTKDYCYPDKCNLGWFFRREPTWLTKKEALSILKLVRKDSGGMAVRLVRRKVKRVEPDVPTIKRIDYVFAKSLTATNICKLAAISEGIAPHELEVFHVARWCRDNLVLIEEDCSACGQSAEDCGCDND